MLAKITGNKIVLFGLIGVVAGLIVSVLLLVVLAPSPAPAEVGKDGKPAAAPKATAVKGKAAAVGEPSKFGDTLVIRDKIVNLADPGGRRYLRFSVAIEFEPHHDPAKAAGPPTYRTALYEPGDGGFQETVAGKDTQKEFEARVKKYVPAMEDVVTIVLSSKTSAELLAPDGKELAKKEIKDRLNRLLQGTDEHVNNIYFTEFVIQ